MNEKQDDLPVIAIDLPVLYEDEGYEEMGESELHLTTLTILYFGLRSHLRSRPGYRVLGDLNFYYHPRKHHAHVSPDVMVVTPPAPLPDDLSSYHLGVHGPAPVLTVEVLSERSAQQQDRTTKSRLYARLGVTEYLLVDVSGRFFPPRLQLRRRRGPRSWDRLQDADGGVTSQLGFRIVVEADGQARVLDASTGRRYPRPDEADAEAEARAAAEARVRELEAELARLRGQTPPSA
jgi:Uma2 family endonuclease